MTPRYNYNQILYRLDLDDPRLLPARQKGKARLQRASRFSGSNELKNAMSLVNHPR